MEDELRCPVCKQLYSNPVLLPCSHALCMTCAIDVQTSTAANATVVTAQIHHPPQSSSSLSSSSSSASSTAAATATSATSATSNHHPSSNGHISGTESTSSDQDQSDKVSILSEADSGVVCCTSRPSSYAGTPNLQHQFPASGGGAYSLVCPVCSKIVFFDEQGVQNLPTYHTMETIIDRFCEREALRCQMCEREPKVASLICEQCLIRYCDGCRELCHPARGPLAKHTLVRPRGSSIIRESVCVEHSSEPLTMYCLTCRSALCSHCTNDNRHQVHEVQPITAISKSHKTELSHNLQHLSEKARSTTEFIQRLKGMSDTVTESCQEFEQLVIAQFEAIIHCINGRRDYLLSAIRMDRDNKIRILKEQQSNCTSKLQKTTGLIQFCIEALKETDNAAFLQVGSMLINRVKETDKTWHQDVTNAAPRVSPIVDLMLDDAPLLHAIDQLNLIQLHSPLAPIIVPDDCSAENNSVTVSWKPPNKSFVEGYVLELDDGNGGEFREVYCGKEAICTVDGLHFNSTYNARVKAFNFAGEGEYSELIGLQTAEVAWFTLDPELSNASESGMYFSHNDTVVTVDGWEHRVGLGSVGFSRGVHYWEFTIEKYVPDTDPAFGVARIDVARDKMLGKDDKSFAMYIDGHRSWFQHNSMHERRVEGGISTGSRVGVLLDLDRHTLSFLVNDMPQGSVAFRDLYGVFYPAVSLSRGVVVKLHSAIDAPTINY